MIFINPDVIDVDVTNVRVEDDQIKTDWTMSVPEQGGTAYFRISPEFRKFLELCHKKHGIIGFEYDLESCDLNFGVVLSNKNEATDGQPTT